MLVFDKFVTRIHIDYVDSEEKYNNFIESPLFNNLSNKLADLGWSIEPEWNTSKNKMESKSQVLTPGSTSRDGGTNVIVYQPSSSPQVYEKYPIAPAYRRAVIASYSLTLSVLSDSETFLHSGDVVDVVDGAFNSEGAFIQTKMSSGKYVVMRKGYHYNRLEGSGISTFVTTVHLMSNNANVGKDG